MQNTSYKQDIQVLENEFRSCQKILSALGDPNRQHMILSMLQLGECDGVRVGAITERADLSRPAVSHHLKILREAGLVKMRREGTRNYYYFDADSEALSMLIDMLSRARNIMEHLPDRCGKE